MYRVYIIHEAFSGWFYFSDDVDGTLAEGCRDHRPAVAVTWEQTHRPIGSVQLHMGKGMSAKEPTNNYKRTKSDDRQILILFQAQHFGHLSLAAPAFGVEL